MTVKEIYGNFMGKKHKINRIINVLNTISSSIDRLGNQSQEIAISLSNNNAYYYDSQSNSLISIDKVNAVPFELLLGIDHASNILLQNTIQFAQGFCANNALLWGARGMGKSSLIKSIHQKICVERENQPAGVRQKDQPAGVRQKDQLAGVRQMNNKRLILVEIGREDLSSLPSLMRALAKIDAQFLIFCDDLSFDKGDTSYKSLKTVLDGGLEGRPKNVLFYATSNRRHLMAREMIENERSSAINPSEAVEEKVSLSDRFGLSLGFHHCDQNTYLAMVQKYVSYYKLEIDEGELKAEAIEWSATRGARSGRVAIQFVRHLAGKMHKNI